MPASDPKIPGRVAIWGHFHGGNLGDDLVVSSLIAHLRARRPGVEIIAISLNPSDTRARHGIESFPLTRQALHSRRRTHAGASSPRPHHAEWTWGPARALRDHAVLGPPARRAYGQWKRWRRRLRSWRSRLTEPAFAWRSLRSLRDVDLLVVAGSGPLYDGWDGAWVHGYNLFKWTWLARLSGTAVHMLSVGSGPIDSRMSRFFLRGALARASYASFRDESSLALVRELKLLKDAPVVPDQAFARSFPQTPKRGSNRRIVGVNPMAHQDPRYLPRGDDFRYQEYVDTLATFVAWLLDRDHEVRLLYSARPDLRVCHDLQERLRAKGSLAEHASLLRQEIVAEQQLIQELQDCDFVVAARYHCLLVPAAMGIPVLGLAYHPKTFDLMRRLGQSRFALDINDFSSEELVDSFRELSACAPRVHEQLAQKARECRDLVEAQYDDVYGPVLCPSTPEAAAQS